MNNRIRRPADARTNVRRHGADAAWVAVSDAKPRERNAQGERRGDGDHGWTVSDQATTTDGLRGDGQTRRAQPGDGLGEPRSPPPHGHAGRRARRADTPRRRAATMTTQTTAEQAAQRAARSAALGQAARQAARACDTAAGRLRTMAASARARGDDGHAAWLDEQAAGTATAGETWARAARLHADDAARHATQAQRAAGRREASPAAPRQAIADGWARAADAADSAANAADDAGQGRRAARLGRIAEACREGAAEHDTGHDSPDDGA